MNKKYIMPFMIGMFVMIGIGITIAGALLSVFNPDVELSKESRDKLIEMNLDNPNISSCVQINEDECIFSMSKGDYKLGSHKIPLRYCDTIDEDEESDTFTECLSYTDYTEEELAGIVKDKSQEWLEEFGQVLIKRDNNNYGDVKLGGGQVAITEKK